MLNNTSSPLRISTNATLRALQLEDVAELERRLHRCFGSKRRFLVVDDKDAFALHQIDADSRQAVETSVGLDRSLDDRPRLVVRGGRACAPADRATAQAASRNIRMTSSALR